MNVKYRSGLGKILQMLTLSIIFSRLQHSMQLTLIHYFMK
ncbi:unnamed protein product [Onchocerca flexuosa]|uniref:Uncharacterized protein n=1 Tax=Onchocerca flexuosa TaxID=387005 RepID=A0A183HTK0_9BILA|nr:unnamed protein product [Onchocerca flexuosa]